MPAVIILGWLFFSLFWGSLCKVIASNKGLRERNAYWLGFFLWFLGLIVVIASSPEQPRRVEQPATVAAPGPAHLTAPSIADEIGKLARLRDAGELTPEQYEAQRARLLS